MRKPFVFFVVLIWTLYVQSTEAREAVWRCGQEFTDKPSPFPREACQLLVNNRMPVFKSARIDRDAQRVRDTHARAILEAELRQAELRHAELSRGSTNSPSVQAAIMRTQGDIAGLRREIERVR